MVMNAKGGRSPTPPQNSPTRRSGRPLAEDAAGEQVQIVAPHRELVRARIEVPDVRHVLLFQVRVRAG